MTPYFSSNGIEILHGDALLVLRELPADSVNCCVTSPPYWGLRDYGCDGQMGLESTPEQYVERMVAVFAEVRRVMRDDGTLWLNIGDSYASDPGKGGSGTYNGRNGNGEGYAGAMRAGAGRADGIVDERGQRNRDGVPKTHGLKAKDLVGIPWRVAFALQSDGWYLRQDIIWSKPNPMPESVTDRCTKAHEYLFMLSKSARYYYDQEAIKEPATMCEIPMPKGWDTSTGNGGHGNFHKDGRQKPDKQRVHSRRHAGFNDRWDQMERDEQCSGMRNKRSVWEIATRPFAEAHFATFPEDLIKPCILAGCPAGGTVLDPFGGSMTTMKVARDLNCKGIAIELNAEYIEIGKRRLKQEVFDFGVTA